MRFLLPLICFFIIIGCTTKANNPKLTVTPVPSILREAWGLDPFYKKYLDICGMALLSSDQVHDVALLEAHYIISNMIGHRPDILRAIGKTKVRLAIMAPNEFTTDVPEHSAMRPRFYWDRRARGLGAKPERPCVSCGEENLLCLEGDPYAAENILVHEFAHVIHHCGLNTVDPTFDDRLAAAFANAEKLGLWKGKYAGTNRAEYWAEGVQSWFNDNRTNDHDHNHVHLRSQLKEYDPQLASLCHEVFGELEWSYLRPDKRTPPAPHFAMFDHQKYTKTFSWDELRRQQDAGLRGGERNQLVLQLPDASPHWKSTDSKQKVEITICNSYKKNLVVYWVDQNGKGIKQIDLRSAQAFTVNSFVGHVFSVHLAEDDSVIGYFVAGDEDSDMVLKEPGK